MKLNLVRACATKYNRFCDEFCDCGEKCENKEVRNWCNTSDFEPLTSINKQGKSNIDFKLISNCVDHFIDELIKIIDKMFLYKGGK